MSVKPRVKKKLPPPPADTPKPKRGAGRNTVRTDDVRHKILEVVELGATYRLACEYAGISETTFYDWRANDAEFSDALKRAESKGAVEHLKRIKYASLDGAWQASAWWLERLRPTEYGKRIDATIRGELTIKTFGDVINEGGIAHDNNNQNADNPDNEDEFA